MGVAISEPVAPRSTTLAGRLPLVVVKPIWPVSTDPALPEIARATTLRLRTLLGLFDEIDVATADGPAKEPVSFGDYVVEGHIGLAEDGRPRLSVEVVARATRRVIGSFVIDATPDAPPGQPFGDPAIRSVAAGIAQSYGLIVGDQFGSGAAGAASLPFGCIVDAIAYRRSFAQDLLAPTVACLQRTIHDDPGFSLAHAFLALLYVDAYRSGIRLPAGPADLVAAAYQSARQAIEQRPLSARAFQAFTAALTARGDLDGALAMAEKA